MATKTPWGPSQHSERIARGIMRYDTASHGGIHLSKMRMFNLPPLIKAIAPFTKEGWYEEDVDWALTALAYPNEFDERACYYALRTVTHQASLDRPYWPALDVEKYLQTREGHTIQQKAGHYNVSENND